MSDVQADTWQPCNLKEEVRRLERFHIEHALKAAEGDRARAASMLGLNSGQTLASKLRRYFPDLRKAYRKRRRSIIKYVLPPVERRREVPTLPVPDPTPTPLTLIKLKQAADLLGVKAAALRYRSGAAMRLTRVRQGQFFFFILEEVEALRKGGRQE